MRIPQHGVKRSRISAEVAKSKREAEQSKIDAYRSLSSDCLERVSDWD